MRIKMDPNSGHIDIPENNAPGGRWMPVLT